MVWLLKTEQADDLATQNTEQASDLANAREQEQANDLAAQNTEQATDLVHAQKARFPAGEWSSLTD